MKDDGVIRRRTLSVMFVLLYSLFLLETVLPQTVWCHKPDGRTAVEFEITASLCQCDDCERCRELNRTERLGLPAAGFFWEPAHCLHEPIPSEAVQASSFVPHQDDSAVHSIAVCGASCILEISPILSSTPAAPPRALVPEQSPPAGLTLRC